MVKYTTLFIREMQIKTTVWYYFMPSIITIMKIVKKIITSIDKDMYKLESSHIVGGNIELYSYFRKHFGMSSEF